MKCDITKKLYVMELSHPARGAWIEIGHAIVKAVVRVSHPARGAWIEMWLRLCACPPWLVAPRKGCVD